jgi:glycosyltransferase involved in cell wall biosynthesis
MDIKNKKIAIVHDHLGFRGGGERTVLLLAMYLKADFITAYADKNTYPEYQKELGNKLKILTNKIIYTRVVRFFWLRSVFWFNRKKFKDYDILIASSQTATEAVAHYSKKRALKIVYTHTTPRRVFDLYEMSKKMYPWFLQPFYVVFAKFWKRKYLKAIKKFNLNIANSNNTRQRIKDHTKSDANLVAWPPIMTDKFKWIEQGDYFLSFGRVDEAKRIELIVEAFKDMPDKKLIVASGGPRLKQIKEMAKGFDNIEIKGWVEDSELIELIGKCQATIYIPIDEDAGMTHLESNIAGKTFLGVKEGGLIESSIDNETCILLPSSPTKEDVIQGVKQMTKEWCLARKEICEEHASKYNQEKFFQKIEKIINKNNPEKKIFGIDASRWENPAFPGKHKRTGVEMVSVALIKALASALQKKNIVLRLYTPRTIKSLALDIQKVIPANKAWTRKQLNNELRYSPIDYFFTPSYYIPKNAPKNSFSIIHDVIFKSNPEKYALKERLWQNIVTKINIKRSKKIFTVSEFSKNEIIREYKLGDEKVIAFKMGYSSNIQCSIFNVQSKRKQIVYVGRIEKKKSVDVLIKAFADFVKIKPDWDLLLLGSDNGFMAELKELAVKLGIDDKIVFKGYVSEEEKWRILGESLIFVHPSACEGCSIPMLEAFDAGLPAVVCGVEVLKEVGEDAALYFKAGDAIDLSRKLLEIANDKVKQADMVKKGKEELEKHSWERAADLIIKEIGL